MNEIFKDRFEIIDKLYNIELLDLMGSPVRLLMHAVLNTITLLELVKFYVKEKPNSQLIVRNILRRLPEDDDKSIIYDYVFEELKLATYINRLRYRKFLEIMLEKLDETRQQEYFTYFSNSSYVYEVRSAVKMTNWIWSPSLQSQLIIHYYKTNDPYILEVLIKNLDKDDFLILAKKIWNQNLPNVFKPKFIERVKGWPLADIEFVQLADPGNFLVLARYVNETIKDEILLDCYNRVSDAYKPFAIWNLGKLGKWQIIKDPVIRFINNPDSVFKEFSETTFD